MIRNPSDKIGGFSHGATALQTRDYLYNSVGNRSAMRIDAGDWDVYAYDAVDQLVSVNYGAADSAGASPARSVGYGWDAVGNRVEVAEAVAGSGQTTDNYSTANAVNQYPSINGHSLTHDGNGNLTSARLDPQGPAGLYGGSGVATATLAYDSSNRLLSVSKGSDNVVQTYDTRNRVTSRTVNGQTTYFLWDDWDLIEERNAGGDQIRRYVHGAGVDEPLMMVDANGPRYYVQDALGSVTALTDEYGAVVESYRYDVFGTVSAFDGSGALIAGGPAAGNRILYTGREWIGEAGLYDYRNRVYSPVLGRFLQNDPIRFEAGDVNLYRYVGNSAVDWGDPMGLNPAATGRPPMPVPGGGPNNDWKFNPNPNNKRGGNWGPKNPIPGQSQPSASWDPDPVSHGEPHWDVDDGKGNRKRYDANGKPIPDEDPDSEPDDGKSVDPEACAEVAEAIGWGVIAYWVISELSRLFPPRNLIPVP